jgi:beta-galactosidase
MRKYCLPVVFQVALLFFMLAVTGFPSRAQTGDLSRQPASRERISMDRDWRFALGHAFETKKDFDNGSGYFSYITKAGYGDGAADPDFDDQAWRSINIPHDWCVELPFDSTGGHSHGYKAIGRNFPGNSVGWYRKSFYIPESDLGRRISIEFDGVHRNAVVWVNGFYLGTEHSGYSQFAYDISDYLNYGGKNVVAVRADATMEEGWFYEGAGIYRHVWLTKTAPLHVERNGTFITTDIRDNKVIITVRTTVINESDKPVVFDLKESMLDATGNTVTAGSVTNLYLQAHAGREYCNRYTLDAPNLWSPENPYLHKLITTIHTASGDEDRYETTFGIRTVKFDPDKGFFLNGKSLKIVGTNIHQDHACVGTAIPDALQEYRIRRLKDMGSNAIRTSHNPPTPELLNACDRLGMLVLDENRLMGTNEEHFSCIERLMKRDRNHPSVILWSLGNEEWSIEGNIRGSRIATTMQNFAQQLDSSRAFTIAVSGGWENGIGRVMQVMGYNYLVQGDIDLHHANFPWQAGIGTEETNYKQTRGIYKTDPQKCYMELTSRMPENVNTEAGWKYFAARPFLSGLFYWTGFDYRGESNPWVWPAVINQSGNIDLCGFPKDSYYYLKSWWGKEPVLHITPHWNWKGHEGEKIKVTVYSNCEQVELLLNNKSLGKKQMPLNGHLEWNVGYKPGVLMARGIKGNTVILTDRVETTGNGSALQLEADRNEIAAGGSDVAVITVKINDAKGLMVPTACNEVFFTIEGPGRILGVGNGDPSSHEADRYFETISTSKIENLKELSVENLNQRKETAPGYDDSDWIQAFSHRPANWMEYTDTLIVVRGTFELPAFSKEAQVNLFVKSITDHQSIFVNGHNLATGIHRSDTSMALSLDQSIIRPGRNEFAITGQRFRLSHEWDEPNRDPGIVQVIEPPQPWKRKVFNGLAQVIVQSEKQSGEIILKAGSEGLQPAVINIKCIQK